MAQLKLPNGASRFDVFIVRDIDGVRIVAEPRYGLTGGEVLALHYEQEALPGELVHFHAVPTPRPWERFVAEDDPTT